MANPDFLDESVADQEGAGPITVFMPGSWAAGQIALLFVASDGGQATLSTPNGFVLAQDPNGNSAHANAGTGVCSITVFWKRMVGSTTATDPAPVIAAASTWGGTCIATHMSTYSNCRSSGTPFHIIASQVVSTATATIAPPAVTPTLNGCTLVTCCAGEIDDQAFNAWTFSGAASPAGQLDNGWHSATGNACCFVGGRGGYATAGGSRSGSSTFGGSTRQAQLTMVLASLNEAFGPEVDDLPRRLIVPMPPVRIDGARPGREDEIEPPVADDDAGALSMLPAPSQLARYVVTSDDEVSVAAGGIVADDDSVLAAPVPAVARVPAILSSGDEIPTAAGVSAIDENGSTVAAVPAAAARQQFVQISDDEIPTAAGGSAADEDDALVIGIPAAFILPLPVLISDDELSPLGFIVDDDAPIAGLTPAGSLTTPVRLPDDEFPGGSLPAGVDPDDGPRPVLAPQRPALITIPTPAEEFAVQVTSGIGGAADAHRSFLAPPQTGTLTTPAPQSSWTTSHAYVIDPTQGGQNRVLNGGNLYQCTQDGTSASSGGGPTGTGTNIVDNTVRWRFIGPAQGQNTAAGSQILCTIMRGNQSQAASVAPTDNDGGGTYIVIANNEYVNFTGSFAGVWRRPTASNAKTNFAASGVWGGSGGAGDEMSIGWIEIQGVQVGAPHAFSHVERLASSGGSVTAASITTTVPCIIISYWFGNGTVQTAGQPDAATPAGGLALIAGSSQFISLTTNGYVQHMVAWRKQATPGTFAEVWTASPTDEGAQLVTIAYQDLSAPSGLSVDDEVVLQRPRVIAGWGLRAPVQADDELTGAGELGDDDAPRPGLPRLMSAIATAAPPDDEVAGLVVVDDDGTPVVGMLAAPTLVPVTAVDIDELPVIALEEWGQVMAVPVVVVPVPVTASSDDETATPAPIDEDAILVAGVPTPTTLPLVAATSDDEIAAAGAASQVEEDATVSTVPTVMRPWLVVPPSVDEVASASGANTIEDDGLVRPGVAPVPPVMSPTLSDDEVGTALAVDEDTAGAVSMVAAAGVPLRSVADDDAFSLATLDEDQAPLGQPPTPVPALLYVASDDGLPLVALLDDAGQLLALTWSVPWVGQSSSGDDDLATVEEPAVIVDEDQLLMPLVWQVPVQLWTPPAADELPKAKKAKPAGGGGTGLLDGFIAKQVAQALVAAKLYKPGVLIKVTPGVRTPGAVTAGTNPTTASYKFKGIEQNLLSLQLAGTLINGVDAAIRLFGATIEGGQVPVPGDRIAIGGKTYTIVAGGVSRDPASASYLCQVKL